MMFCEVFLYGFDLIDIIVVLIGLLLLLLKISGVVKIYICFDNNVVFCFLYVFDVDNDIFFIGWDIMCNFD